MSTVLILEQITIVMEEGNGIHFPETEYRVWHKESEPYYNKQVFWHRQMTGLNHPLIRVFLQINPRSSFTTQSGDKFPAKEMNYSILHIIVNDIFLKLPV